MMELNIVIDNYTMNLEVPEDLLTASSDSFDRLDASMAKGIQMGRSWVPNPNREQCCQVAADRLLTALETDNENLALLSAGYILSRLPGVRRVRIDNSGEMIGTQFE